MVKVVNALVIAMTIMMVAMHGEGVDGARCPTLPGCLSAPSTYCGEHAPCCPGLECVPFDFPGSSRQPPISNITICKPSPPSGESSGVGGGESSWAPYPAPILPTAWHAKAKYTNLTDGGTGYAEMWYDASSGGMRTDFGPQCPFLQLYHDGIDSNYVPCSVIFFKEWEGIANVNAYVYPSRNTSCVYSFPPWEPDYLCSSNATWGGRSMIQGQEADLWRVEWYTFFPHTEPTMNIRNTYTAVGSSTLLRLREDLDTGYLDFYDFEVLESVPDDIFLGPLSQPVVGHGAPTCTHYNSQSSRYTWPTGFHT